jgi:hypothetical protein
MASFTFSNLPDGVDARSGASPHLTIKTATHSADDANGAICSGPKSQSFEIDCPISGDNELPLLAVANASTSDGWKTKKDERAHWVHADFVLDNQGGWEIRYECEGVLIDGYSIQASASGVGYEEVLVCRVLTAKRSRNRQAEIKVEY